MSDAAGTKGAGISPLVLAMTSSLALTLKTFDLCHPVDAVAVQPTGVVWVILICEAAASMSVVNGR